MIISSCHHSLCTLGNGNMEGIHTWKGTKQSHIYLKSLLSYSWKSMLQENTPLKQFSLKTLTLISHTLYSWLLAIATCPFAGGRRVTRGMRVPRKEYARSRHQRLFVENVGKTEGRPVKKKILSSGVVFTLEESISTSHVCLKGQQPLIECANMTLIFYVPFYVFIPFIYFFFFLWSTRVFPFAPTYSSIVMEKSDLRSSCLCVNQVILFLLERWSF